MSRAVVASGNNRSDSPFAPLEVHPSSLVRARAPPLPLLVSVSGRPRFPPLRYAATVHRDSAPISCSGERSVEAGWLDHTGASER